MDTQVLIIGAGPVGLTLALDLGRRGVRCTLIERKDAPQRLPKMERCNARSTLPGVRLPHVWLEGGVAMQDKIGDGYTLLRLGGSKHDASALQTAFAAIGAPFTVLDVPDPTARDIYARDLILLRPDMHIAWRGNSSPGDPQRLAAVAMGHAT